MSSVASFAVPPDSSLVLLQKGMGHPVFICHALSGSAWVALPLMRTMKLKRPVYVTQAPDLDAGPDVMSLDEMVARYTRDIRAIQPHGPYSVMGYSFGAMLALEIANRLAGEGQTVDHLVIFDQPAPPARPSIALARAGLRARHALCAALDTRLIRRAAPALRWPPLIAAMNCLGPGPLTAAELRRVLRLVFPSTGAAQITPDTPFERLCDVLAADLERSIEPAQWQSLIRYAKTADNVARIKALKVYAKNRWIARIYRPRAVFPGCIRIYAGAGTHVNGWQAFSARPLDVHTVPAPAMPEMGAHAVFVDKANAALFGDDLRRVLES